MNLCQFAACPFCRWAECGQNSANRITAAQDEFGTRLQIEHAEEMGHTWPYSCLDKFCLLEPPGR